MDAPEDRRARDSLSTFAAQPHQELERGRQPFSHLEWRDSATARAANWLGRAPAASLPICLIGDSQLRNLGNSLQALASGGACDAVLAQRNKSLCSGRVAYHLSFNDATSRPTMLSRKLFAKLEARHNFSKVFGRNWSCGAVLLNFGQWGISFDRSVKKMSPYSASRYANLVAATLAPLVAYRKAHGVPVAWVSMNPSPLAIAASRRQGTYAKTLMQHRMIECPPREWRMPHVTHAFNEAAREEVARAGVDYLDLEPIALDLLDLSFDSIHYQDPVGTALARAVLGWHESVIGKV